MSTLALDPLLPSYAAISYALVDKTQGLLGAYINSSGVLVAPLGITIPAGGTFSNAGDSVGQSQVLAADGAITIKSGTVIITKGTAASITLGAPTATTDDGKKLIIESTTAAAHTVTNTPGFNNGSTASDVATFGAAIANSFEVIAYQGVWYTFGAAKGVTLG